MRNLKSPIVAALASAALTASVVGGVAVAQTATPRVINACYDKTSGNVRLVSSTSDCRANETFTFWNEKGEKGDKGDPGANGTNGTNGVSGRTVVAKDVTVPNLSHLQSFSVECPPGTAVMSGGYVRPNVPEVEVYSSYPWENAWLFSVRNSSYQNWGLRLNAVCATAS